MGNTSIGTRLALVMITTLAALFGLVGPAQAAQAEQPWTGTWMAAQLTQPPSELNWSGKGFADQTVRQVVRVSTGGTAARVRLSNTFGSEPLRVAGATIAHTTDAAAIEPGSVRPLTMGSRTEFVIQPGEIRASDPVGLPVSPLDELTVTLYFDEPTGKTELHSLATATSYRAEGDHRADHGGRAFNATSESWYYLTGVDVLGTRPRSMVAFGDSITDGYGSTPGANNRYPDELAERIARSGEALGVLNSGISGNRMLNDSLCAGESAVKRFERDVLEQPGVRSVIILEGINDIGSSENEGPCNEPNPEVTAAQLIEGHRELIGRAHANGIKAIGATLLPYQGAHYYSERGEAVRQQVNDWIRNSGEYDAVVDFDRVMADPANPLRMAPAYDSGDHLHPSDAGYRAMAKAIDLNSL